MGRWAQQRRRGGPARGAGSPAPTISWTVNPFWDGNTSITVSYSANITALTWEPQSFSVVHLGTRIYATSLAIQGVNGINYSAPGFAAIADGDIANQLFGPPQLIVPQQDTIIS